MWSDFTKALILLVDDDRLVRRLLPAALGGVGAEIATAGNAEEALAFMADRRPDLILCDAVMPMTDGFMVCARVKAEAATHNLPFAILTSLSRNVAERSIQAGADDYFQKNGNEALLRLRVRLLLELSLRGARLDAPLEAFAGDQVLLASPSAPLHIQLSLHLNPAGLQVESCPRASGLLDRLAGPPPALLILDQKVEDGVLADLVEAVRRHAAWAQVPVLVLADKQEEHALEAMEDLVQDWLTKPLDSREIRRRVLLLLGYARAVRGQ